MEDDSSVGVMQLADAEAMGIERQVCRSTRENIKFSCGFEETVERYRKMKVKVEDDEVDLLSKHEWIERARRIWDLENDGAIRSQIQSEKLHFSIHIYGSIGEGCGAILRDSQKMPVVASCQSLSHEDSVSTFYTWLKGVALGAKIAVKYRLSQFYLYVPSKHMYSFISGIWDPHYRGPVSESYLVTESDLKSVWRPEDGDIEKIYRLTSDIVSDLNQLYISGVNSFVVQPVSNLRNKAAEFLSKLSVDKEDMKFAEICGNERLSDILYEDAFS